MRKPDGVVPMGMRRLTFLIVFVAFAFSCGGEWPVLQCVAWANMVRDYSETVPLAQAVQMTFSGEYPCAMCRAIAEKKQSERTQAVLLHKQEKKLVCSGSVEAPVRAVTVTPQGFASWKFCVHGWSETPPVPPPRLA